MIIWRSWVQSWLCSIFVHSIRQQSPCGPVSVLGLHTESKLCYIGVPAKLAPASPRGLTRTPHKSAQTPSDSVAFRIGMVRNMWRRVKTSISISAQNKYPSSPLAGFQEPDCRKWLWMTDICMSIQGEPDINNHTKIDCCVNSVQEKVHHNVTHLGH